MTFGAAPPGDTLARVVRTRSGRDGLPGQASTASALRRRFVVDFAADGGGGAGAASPPPEAVVETSTGAVSDVRVEALPGGAGWRASFLLEPEGGRAADMRLWLHRGGTRVSETWTRVWYGDDER